MERKARYPDRNSSKTTVYADASYHKARFVETCSKHDQRLKELGLDDLVIERGGATYQLRDPEETVIGYCPECLASTRHSIHGLRDASDRELVAKRIRENWRAFSEVFEPVAVSVGGLSNCPYCGVELQMVNRDTGKCVCPEHGEMNVSIKQFDLPAQKAAGGEGE